MSASDQSQAVDAAISDREPENEVEPEVEPEPEFKAEAEAEPERQGLTPRQARRVRIAVASVLMVAMAVVLWVRLASRASLLVVADYGLALILCGFVIELSRSGRTRLASWLLGAGLVAAVAADWLVLP
ncbi:hypothetical protein [Streptomyces sp. NBC_01465]|uniref:hypothetical protein n=1 Tax=Streptomyces sp. NBC_01465 TaxID=2903878 RepID=UPI002E3281F4|nr:hypothetical protein [Streptomyces sp. NBC_01465]